MPTPPLVYEPLPGGGSLALVPALFDANEASDLFARIADEADLRERSIVLFGREVPQPRLVGFEGADGVRYRYSGRTLDAAPFGPTVGRVRAAVERATGLAFDAVLLNLYRDGRDSVGLHADDEPELGPDPVIASVSFGAVRRFVLRARAPRRGGVRVALDLPHGSLLVMGEGTQRAYRHELPKQPAVDAPRLNLTFRRVLCRDDARDAT